MNSSVVKPVWKYSWNPKGNGVENITVDTSKNKISDLIYLKHSYFRAKEFAAEIGNNSLTIGYEDKNPSGSEDLILKAKDAALSSLGDSGIYRAVELASARSLNSNLVLHVNFIADAINPDDLGQDLNPEADVIHNSITAKLAQFGSANITDLSTDILKGAFGNITEDILDLKASKATLKDVVLQDGEVHFKSPLEISCNEDGKNRSEKGSIRYNKDTYLWEVWNTRSERYTPLILSHEDVNDIPPGSVPVILSNDVASLSFLDWLTIDEIEEKLKTSNIELKVLWTDSSSVHIAEGSTIYLGNHTIRDSNGVLTLDNMISIDSSSNKVTIGGMEITPDLIATLKVFEKRLNDLDREVEILKDRG